MPRFVVKKLPPHWRFVPSKRRLREILAELGADVRLVEFYGTGYNKADWLSLGFVESRVFDGNWCFYIRLSGSREELVGPIQKEFEAMAIAEIAQYMRGRFDQAPTEIVKPEQFHLSFRINDEVIFPCCSLSPLGKATFYPTRAWWRSESIA